MKRSVSQSIVVVAIFICIAFHSHLADGYEKEFPEDEKSEDKCPEYGAVTKIVTYFSNHLSNIIKGKDNVFFSPLAISISLAMLYLGARGETAKDIEISLGYKKLNLSNPSEDIHRVFHDTLDTLKTTSDAYHLEVANGIFIQNSFDVSPNYIQDLERFYFSELHPVDFRFNDKEAAAEINAWVSKFTDNKITSLLNEPLDPVTVMILANAIYFKGIWKYPFNPKLTMEKNFYSSANVTKRVKFMELKNTVLYFHDDITNYTFLELDYNGNDTSMIIALPYNRYELPKLEVSTSLMCRVRKNFKPTKMHVMLPRFQISYERELSKDLYHLGMGDLFSEERANLTGIRPQNDLFVSAMLHKAMIEVTEEGSTASASTGVSFDARSGHNRHSVFKADHPFLFSIVDKKTEILLFLGKVADL